MTKRPVTLKVDDKGTVTRVISEDQHQLDKLRSSIQIIREEMEKTFNFLVENGVKPTIAATDACNLMAKASTCLDQGSAVRKLFRDMLEHLHRQAQQKQYEDGRRTKRK